jgi:hypothetical protein
MMNNETLKIELKRQINYMRDALVIMRTVGGWLGFLQDNIEKRTPPRFIRWLFMMPEPCEKLSWGMLDNAVEAGEARIFEMEKALREQE